MEWTKIVIFTALVVKHFVTAQDLRSFPEGFKFGVATAAYQIEGAWNEDGKSESIWDRLTHTNPCHTADCKNGDNATDSYHKMDRDVEMLRELGVDHYRFSIAWTRILPKGIASEVNYVGVAHYNDFISKLLKYNIEPLVTIYHWDLPQVLQDMGGWTSPAIIDWFGDYARVLFQNFGSRVKRWITINEPFQVCYFGYEIAYLAPALNLPGLGVYMCNKNLLLAHANAWHIYNDEFRRTQNGQIGLTVAIENYEPNSPADIEAVDVYTDFVYDTYLYPIFSAKGGYPPKVKERVANKSASQGLPRSRLPEFTPQEIAYVKGTSDFLGMNHYSTYIVRTNATVIGISRIPSFADDVNANFYQKPDWIKFPGELMKNVPWGFYKILTKLRNDYNNPPIFITENGYAYNTKILDDDYRISYHRGYLNSLLDAIDDGSNIIGYTIWSLMDNFEWQQSYTQRFGLYEVDFDSPNLTRTPRESAKFYKELLRTRQLTKVTQLPDPEFSITGFSATAGAPTKENYVMAPNNNMGPSNTIAPNNNLNLNPANAIDQMFQPVRVSFLQKIMDCFKTFYDTMNPPRI